MRVSISRFAGALAATALLSACGTTVPLAGSGTAVTTGDGLAQPGLSTPGAGAGAGPGTVGGAPLPTSAGGAAVALGPTGGLSGPAPAGTTTTASSRPLLPGGASVGPRGTAPGLTATTIKIGVFTAQGFGDFAASAGFNVATGDQQAEARATIDWINAHGGLAGRKVIPVFHDISVAGAAANVDNEYAAACAAWTQDDRVYAVVSPVGTVTDTLYDCLSKRGVPTIAAGDSQDAGFFTRYADFYYQPTDLNLRRILSNLVDGLAPAGFFGQAPKIGVVLVDNNNEKTAVRLGLEPALANRGLKLEASYAVPGGTDTSGYQAAVLRFKSAGITHVLFTFGASPLLFMSNAENQAYRPRYGLHSRNSPGALLQGSASARQQQGAMGIGWQPMNDVDQQHDPGVLNSRQKLCLDLMRQSGQAQNGRVALLIGLWLCDNFLFLKDAVAASPDWTPKGLRTGAESLGAFGSASTFASRTGATLLHDGAAQYRLIAFQDDCACYQYVSPSKNAS